MSFYGTVGDTQIEIGICIIWFQGQGFLESVGCFAVLVQTEIRGSQIIINNGVFWSVLRRVLISLYRLCKLPKIVIRIALILESLGFVAFGHCNIGHVGRRWSCIRIWAPSIWRGVSSNVTWASG